VSTLLIYAIYSNPGSSTHGTVGSMLAMQTYVRGFNCPLTLKFLLVFSCYTIPAQPMIICAYRIAHLYVKLYYIYRSCTVVLVLTASAPMQTLAHQH